MACRPTRCIIPTFSLNISDLASDYQISKLGISCLSIANNLNIDNFDSTDSPNSGLENVLSLLCIL